jgi:hypothetical protein
MRDSLSVWAGRREWSEWSERSELSELSGVEIMRFIIRASVFFRTLSIVCVLGFSAQTLALGVADLSNKEAAAGLKEALGKGAEVAVGQLGKPNGFMGDSRVRIPLPESARTIETAMRTFGMKKQADELVETMNRAAEMAVVEARPILSAAVKNMSFEDARQILSGGDNAATQYFRRTTSGSLTAKFLPIVKKSTAKLNLAGIYNQYAGQASQLGLMAQKDANLDAYVTEKAMDGLFLLIAEQEKAIRQDPVGAGSSLLQKVFGAVRR